MTSKSIFASKTFWGAVLTLVAALGQPFGLVFGEGELTGIADAAASLIGFVLTVYGRMKASRGATLTLPKSPPLVLVAILAGALATQLIGCASGPLAPADTREAINEAKILVIATLKQVAANVRAGTMTDAERVEIVEKMDKHYTDLKFAEDLLATGHADQAALRAEIVGRLIGELHRQVAAKARSSMFGDVPRAHGWPSIFARAV